MRRTVDEHLEVVLGRVTALPAFDQPLMEALGLVLCEDVVSGVSLPGFDNSAMDGYAVQAADWPGRRQDNPITLPVVGEFRGRPERTDRGDSRYVHADHDRRGDSPRARTA